MAAVATHRFISWPPHLDKDGRILIAVTMALDAPTRPESWTTIASYDRDAGPSSVLLSLK
jgi:hypothetical protein